MIEFFRGHMGLQGVYGPSEKYHECTNVRTN